MLQERYVAASELARRLGVRMEHFRWLVRCGKVPPGEKIGRERLYTRTEADAIADWYDHYRAAREGMAWK
jgi:hypothetical protein